MSLSVGIVGLPNAGKSTLFNALASRRLAETAPRAFTTIDPHEAVVSVPDDYLDKLYDLVGGEIASSQTPRNDKIEKVSASVTFIDIAGLVKDAHKGEGLGNQFLAKIREVDAIVHVVRAFANPEVSHQYFTENIGTIAQIKEDIEIVDLELNLAEIEKKPTIYVLNADEDSLGSEELDELSEKVAGEFVGDTITLSAKLEEDMADLDTEERRAFLKEYGIEKSGLEKLVEEAYELLNLISFYTIKGGKEVHAWSLREGRDVLEAAGVVHTDFQENFIKAEVVNVDSLLEVGGWKEAKEKGLIRTEGKNYTVQDKDVIELKTSV